VSFVRGKAVFTSCKVWLFFAKNQTLLFSTLWTILRAIRVLALSFKEALFAVSSEGLFFAEL